MTSRFSTRSGSSRAHSSAMIPGAATEFVEFEAIDADQFLQPDDEVAPFRRNAKKPSNATFAGSMGMAMPPVTTVDQLEDILTEMENGDGSQPAGEVFGSNLGSEGDRGAAFASTATGNKADVAAARRKVEKYKERILEDQEKLKEMKKDNVRLSKENARLKEEAEDDADTGNNADDLNAMLSKAKMSSVELEERREAQVAARKRRADARKQRMSMDPDDVDEAGVDHHRKRRGALEGTWSLMCLHLNRGMHKLLHPLDKHVVYMTARFGGGVGIYFSLLSNMFVTAMLVSFCWIVFWIMHLVDGYTSSSPMSDNLMPSWTLNSSMQNSEATHFIVVFLLSVGFMWYRAISQYLEDDQDAFSIDYFEERDAQGDDPRQLIKYRIVQDALNPWTFAVEDSGDNSDQMGTLANRFKSLLNEMERIEVTNKRTDEEWKWLYARRVAGGFINLVLIGGQWLAIIILTITNGAISEAVGGGSLAAFVVPTIISGVNAALPLATAAITDFERWDERSVHLRVESARLYVSRMLNAVMLVFAYWQLLTGNVLYDRTQAEADTLNWGNCFEDQVGFSMMQLVLADFCVPKITSVGACVAKNWYTRWKEDLPLCSGKFQRQEFDLASELIQMMYTQTLIWMLMPYYSFFCLFSALQHWISFHYYRWILGKYFQKPVGVDVGQMANQISMMYLVTLFACSFTYVGWGLGKIVRYTGCSPFVGDDVETGTYVTADAMDQFWNLIGKDGDGTFYAILTSPFLYIFILAAAFTVIGHKNNYSTGFEKFYYHNITGIERQLNDTQHEVTILKKKLKEAHKRIEDD